MKNKKRYDKYKDSGIAWLGDIPEHWEVRAVRNAFLFETGFTPSTEKDYYYDKNGFTWVTISDLNGKYIKNSKSGISKKYLDENSKAIIPKGALLYSFKLSIGKVAFTAKRLYTNEAIFSILPNANYDLGYYYYSLPKQIIKNASENIYGAKMLNQKLIKEAKIVTPPLTEQTAIANFLDHKTKQINRFIQKKTQLIKLLKEQKTALINDAVTKGLNPKVPMKDSGIDWLGKIPEHWEVRKLKYSVRLNKHTEFEKAESVKNKIALENIEGKTGKIISLSENSFNGIGTIFKDGDVLFGKLRPYLSKVVAPKFEGSCVNELLVLTPNSKDWNSEYLKYRMLATDFIGMVDNSTYGAKMPRATWSFIGSLKIGNPNISEQQSIATHIETETQKIDRTLSTIKKEITLVEEYKTALIAEAVTGKIDVRGFEIPETDAPLAMVAEEAENYNNFDKR